MISYVRVTIFFSFLFSARLIFGTCLDASFASPPGIDDEKRLVFRIERNRVTPGYCLGKQIEIYKSIENVQYHGIEKATETKAR